MGVEGITIDGMEEMEFRRSIEAMLRRGQADEAASRLKALLATHAGAGGILPERFLAVTSSDIRLEGWERLGERLSEYDRPEAAMSAISIDMLDPQSIGVRPDAQGRLQPVIETSYFSDSAYPFSEAGREDLLDGYSSFGCEWQGNFENVDTTISVEGIDDLYGAMVDLENRVASSTKVEPAEIQAGSLGSCYLAVLIHQAIRNAACEKGLPRPICVLAGSNDAYPFFDAPAMTTDEYRLASGIATAPQPDAAAQFEGEFGEDAAQVAIGMASLESLMGLGARKREKKPVLMIDPSEADTAESLEAPLSAFAEAVERRHIMPELGSQTWETDSDALSRHDLTGTTQWDGGTELPFSDESGVPIDFRNDPEPIDRIPEKAPYRVVPDGLSDEPPQERLPEVEPGPADHAPPAPTPSGGPGFGFDNTDTAPEVADRSADRPLRMSPGDVLPDELSTGGFAGQQGPSFGSDSETPLELDDFTFIEEPGPADWTTAYDLPSGKESGDNLPWSSHASGGSASPAMQVPRPARHAIRVIAASVTSESNVGRSQAANQGPSLAMRLGQGFAAAMVRLARRIARR